MATSDESLCSYRTIARATWLTLLRSSVYVRLSRPTTKAGREGNRSLDLRNPLMIFRKFTLQPCAERRRCTQSGQTAQSMRHAHSADLVPIVRERVRPALTAYRGKPDRKPCARVADLLHKPGCPE